MKTHRLIQILGETIGLIALAAASMNCSSHDAGQDIVPDAGPIATDAGPATCKQAKTTYRVSFDGPQILYVNGDKTMPWSAYCAGMATLNPAEYLDLDTRKGEANFSEFSESAVFGHTDFTVRTQFRKVRIDPIELAIDSTDNKFTDRSVNPTDPPTATKSAILSKTIDYMPYAVAESCVDGQFTSAHGNVDLSNSPFEIATEPCETIGDNTVSSGSAPFQRFELSSNHRVFSGSGNPLCGRASLNCLPDPTVNGEVGGEGKIRLRYIGYSAGSQRP